MTSPQPLDLYACAREPIRVPGAIQPFGALIVVHPETLDCLHASANLHETTGVRIAPGESLRALTDAGELVEHIARQRGHESFLLRDIRLAERDFHVLGSLTAQGLFLEFEGVDPQQASLEDLYPRFGPFLDRIGAAPDVGAIAQASAEEIRALTGFNRVLLYTFDRHGDGVVIAEDGDGVLPSYRGLRFPASDIPQQARDLYLLTRIRLIADAGYKPSPVEPAVSQLDGQPLDLSRAALRSVSPVHLEYMRNMGTGSSMSISIIVDGELWGLVSGHSRDPRRLDPQARAVLANVGQIVSLQIEARLAAQRAAERLALKEIEASLLAGLAASNSFQQGLVDNAPGWMRLTRANGAAVVTQGSVQRVGMTPSDEEIAAIAAALSERGEDVFACVSMAGEWPWSRAFASVASGLIAASISRIRPDYIMWFRPEVVRTIEWSGDPAKPVEAGANRLHPRKSFEMWKEQVRLRSLEWAQAEVETAASFRNAVQNFVLRRAEERAELTDRLERANKELESFSYSISHDLRAPFRHIVGFADLLGAKERDLDEKSRHYLRTIAEAAKAAGGLVDDLLSFSQLGRASLRYGPIDMTKLVAEVRASLAPDCADRNIEWRIGDLPNAWGDASMVRQVLQNLIQNAIKYTARRDPAIIRIEGTESGDAVCYAVADNGVGFEMAYVNKLFGVFQRLHRAEDFEGTGIGLALVKRIIDRHGGLVEGRGAPGEGATFTFSLPRRGGAPEGGSTRA